MHITHKAGKALEPATTTTEPFRSAHGIIRNAIAYQDRLRAGGKPKYGPGSLPQQIPSDGTTWGWATRHRFDPAFGYRPLQPGEAPWSPPDPADE